MPGDVNLWPNLTGGEAIDLLGRLRGGTDPRPQGRAARALRARPDQEGAHLLQGQPAEGRARRGAGRDAELLVLDEPTSGLDPLMENVFQRRASREATAAGRSVLLSSHILAEVEKLCDTVTIIRAGRAVQTGTLAELRHLTRTTITATVARSPEPLASLPGVHDLRVDDDVVTFDVDHAEMAGTCRRSALSAYESEQCSAVAGAALPAPVRRPDRHRGRRTRPLEDVAR